jgi:hypothetical protein
VSQKEDPTAIRISPQRQTFSSIAMPIEVRMPDDAHIARFHDHLVASAATGGKHADQESRRWDSHWESIFVGAPQVVKRTRVLRQKGDKFHNLRFRYLHVSNYDGISKMWTDWSFSESRSSG